MHNPLRNFAAFAQQLFDDGYSILPLDGKAPKIAGWQKVTIDQSQIDAWIKSYPGWNIGLRCDAVVMLDIDVPDELEASRLLKQTQAICPGGLVRRRGDSGKLAYLAGRKSDADSEAYRRTGEKQYEHENGTMVEFFDHSGLQMGIYSHGLDGGDYAWDGGSPLTLPLAKLPLVSCEQWGRLRQLMVTQGYRARRPAKTLRSHHAFEPPGAGPQTGWNTATFHEVGRLARRGLSAEEIVERAVSQGWTAEGYTEAQTRAEVSDMAVRWLNYITDSNDHISYLAWRDTWAFVVRENRYYYLPDMTPVTREAWQTYASPLYVETEDARGQRVKIAYCKKFAEDNDALRPMATTVAPEQPMITADHKLNLWTDNWARLNHHRGATQGSEAITLFRALVRFLCDDREEISDELLNWIGFGLFHPAQRVRYAPLLISTLKGAGKTMLMETVAALYDIRNASILGGLAPLTGQFNGSAIAGKQFVGVNETGETSVISRQGIMENLKSIISDDHVSIEFKGRDRQYVENYCRFLFCSNHLDGLPADDNERRIFPIVCTADDPLTPSFYESFMQTCRAEQGLADIAAYLKREHSQALPTRAPRGDMDKVQEALLPEWVIDLNQMIDRDTTDPVAISSRDIEKVVTHLAERNVTPAERKRCMEKTGWTYGKVKGQRAFWRGNPKPTRCDPRLVATFFRL